MLYHGGGLNPSDRAMASAMIAAGALVLPSSPASSEDEGQRSFSRSLRFPCYILLSLLVMQLLPLPLALMQVVSPARATLMRGVIPLAPEETWAPLSVSPARTVLESLTVLDCALVAISVHRLARRARGQWWAMRPLLAGGLLEAIAGVMQASNPNGPATATGTFLNRNHLAGFLELLLPFSLAASWAIWRNPLSGRGRRILLTGLMLGYACLCIGAIFDTYSRMGLLIVLFLIILTMGLILWPESQVSPRQLGITSAFMIALLLAGFAAAPYRLLSRFQHASVIDRDSTQIRFEIWKDSLPLISDYAFTGSGLGTFESVFLKYQRANAAYRVEYAHNDYLQTAAELGLLSFALILFVLASLVYRLYRSIALAAEFSTRCLAIACFSSLLGILLHSLVDFNLRIPVNAVTCAWVAGVGLGTSCRAKDNKELS